MGFGVVARRYEGRRRLVAECGEDGPLELHRPSAPASFSPEWAPRAVDVPLSVSTVHIAARIDPAPRPIAAIGGRAPAGSAPRAPYRGHLGGQGTERGPVPTTASSAAARVGQPGVPCGEDRGGDRDGHSGKRPPHVLLALAPWEAKEGPPARLVGVGGGQISHRRGVSPPGGCPGARSHRRAPTCGESRCRGRFASPQPAARTKLTKPLTLVAEVRMSSSV